MSPLPLPARGEVIFHRACFPALLADDYELRVDHELGVDTSAMPLPGERRFGLRVDGPRFTMESSLIHAVFPPTNGRGAYVSRLPQIVLRRRTIPWERVLPGTTDSPWVALLLFEDGEATTVSPCTVGDVLDGTGLTRHSRLAIGALDAASRAQPCIAIDVPLALFKDIAPMASEVPLLCHVRQVNTEDKELLGMDDDGWFSVVVGNRIPEPGKKYLACLVSLEGAQGYLPTATEAAPLGAPAVHGDFGAHVTELVSYATIADRDVDVSHVKQELLDAMKRADSKYAPLADKTSSSVSGVTKGAAGTRWSDIVVDGREVKVHFGPPTIRLFCLAQWSFECLEGGDFEAIMQALPSKGGVSMLGMPPALARAPGSTDPTETSSWNAALDTGHVPLEHLTREGERTVAWYRGPLTPVGVSRSSEGPFHTSDQARRIDPETGLENLGYAAGFEIGRLLALGDPRFALDLLRWRRGDRMGPEAEIAFDVVNRHAAILARDLPFDRNILFKLPTALAMRGNTIVRGLVSRSAFGRPMDPTGLAGLESRLPGLDAANVAAAHGVELQVVNGILSGATLGGSRLLDSLNIGADVRLERDIERLAANPGAHFAPMADVFDARMQDIVKPRLQQ